MHSSDDSSVSQWIALLHDVDEQAAPILWNRHTHRLRGLVRKRIRGAAYDYEHVAISAFADFCRRLAEGRYTGRFQSVSELYCITELHRSSDVIATSNFESLREEQRTGFS